MSFVIVFTILAVVSMCSSVDDNNPLDSNVHILAQSLRRQLMKDNYDYMSAESEDASLLPSNFEDKQFQDYKSIHKNKTVFDKILKNVGEKKKTEGFKRNMRRKGVYNNVKEIQDQSSVSYSDTKHVIEALEHTVSDRNIEKGTKRKDKLLDNNNVYKNEVGIVTQNTNKISYGDYTLDLNDHTTTIKYKILKVRKSHRRSGNPAMFIQEETPDGVSIVNLGNKAFPVFRLPRHRRQYMHDPDIRAFGDDDDELSPPPVKETEYTVTEATHQNTNETTMKVEGHLNNKLQNVSLRITVTPDAIFVL